MTEESRATAENGKRKVETIDVPFRGKTFRIPKDFEDYPWDYPELIAEGKYPKAMASLLGKEQVGEFRQLMSTTRDFNEFFEAVQDVTGGNS